MQRKGESLGLEVWAPATVNVADSQARIAALRPDLLVVCDYGEILRPETLATSRLGGINLHGSLLPDYRGASLPPAAVRMRSADSLASRTTFGVLKLLFSLPVVSTWRS